MYVIYFFNTWINFNADRTHDFHNSLHEQIAANVEYFFYKVLI